jgi:hypothetical protein
MLITMLCPENVVVTNPKPMLITMLFPENVVLTNPKPDVNNDALS